MILLIKKIKRMKTIKIVSNQLEKEIIPAVTDYTAKKEKLTKNSNELLVPKENYLKQTYHFCSPEDFYKKEIKLYHAISGKEIPVDNPDVYIFMATDSTKKLFLQFDVYKNEVLDSNIHNFPSD